MPIEFVTEEKQQQEEEPSYSTASMEVDTPYVVNDDESTLYFRSDRYIVELSNGRMKVFDRSFYADFRFRVATKSTLVRFTPA